MHRKCMSLYVPQTRRFPRKVKYALGYLSNPTWQLYPPDEISARGVQIESV